jgi:hypothetical protein
MKKFFALLCVVALFAVSGCKKQEPAPPTPPANEKPAATDTMSDESKPAETKPADNPAP